VTDEEFDALVVSVRRQFGDRLPVPGRDESREEVDAREERTRMVLEREIIPAVAAQRLEQRLAPFSREIEDRLVDAVAVGALGLHRIMEHLRHPLAEEIRVDGAEPLEVLYADGRVERFGRLVRRPRDLERVIYEIAAAHQRPFNYTQPFVDVSLGNGVRFHADGMDVVSSPFFTIRRPVSLNMTLEDLRECGTLDDGLLDLLTTAVAARMSIVVVGEMACGKTTMLRALARLIPEDELVATLETDFELALKQSGRTHVREFQARLPTTSDDRGLGTADFIAPVLRSRAEWILLGEVRGSEARAFKDAVGVAKGVMATVHGRTAADGLDRIAGLLVDATTMSVDRARWEIYRNVDLAVHLVGDTRRGRWVSEVIAPFTTDDGARVGWHQLYGTDQHAADGRARPMSAPQSWMTDRLSAARPGWAPVAWQQRRDTWRPVALPAGLQGVR
jgi:pilus assembly protein CpaF